MELSETQVISEIFSREAAVNGVLSPKNVVTRFGYTQPRVHTDADADGGAGHAIVEKDVDGDLLVPRKKARTFISIEHSPSSSLQQVGLQVWRGALLLSDWILHQGPALLKGRVVMELGAGTGLTSIVATQFAAEVIATDVDDDAVLELIRANALTNSQVGAPPVRVYPLDFRADTWHPDVEEALKRATVILAADVIYDNAITEHFIKALTKILNTPPKKSLFFALEKRFVFTIDDLDVVAPCFDHFMSQLEKARRRPEAAHWRVEEIPTTFPQYFHYDRLKQMIFLKISS